MCLKYIILSCFIFISLFTFSQRQSENLDRGVVAVKNASSAYFISWRYLATDPENIQFNLYAKKTGASFVKLNSNPLSITNYQSSTSQVSDGTQLYVKPVINGIEDASSGVFTVNAAGFNAYRSAYLDITYNPAIDGLAISEYSTKFVWPADLDGDGEFDFVVDRLSTVGGNHKIQAYKRDGTLLWSIDVGPNVSISEGQDDMVIAYDLNGDGKAEVVIKSSDGTTFANGKGVNGSTSLDTDNDGIIDYGTQNVKNPPQYISVIDGLTGNEKNSLEMTYPSNYTRTNKALFMGEEYSNLNGHMSILYLDGKHPSVGFIYKTRAVLNQYHWYYASAYGYNASGQLVNWYNWERGTQDAAEFHSIRVADVDFDGKDELLDGGYGIKHDGTLAFNAHISHGDRFRVGDINPERPGLETFAIQQNASSMLGMLLYNSATGEPIKKIFMSGVGDVGRGECMDIDSTRLGYEFYSTMSNMYDAKGNVIYEGDTPFPHEGIWWDGDLLREELSSADGNGFNADIRKYSTTSQTFGSRLIEMAKMTNYAVKSEYGVRPAFFGDISGDWREEVILEKRGSILVNGVSTETCAGFVGFSTDYSTPHRLYCLMQNPAYRMQATTKGYYQSAFPDYYLGTQMPTPPVPPVQTAKLTWKSGTTIDNSSSNWLLNDEVTSSAFANGDDIMFDLSGTSTNLEMNADLAPSKVWAMNPLGKDYIIAGTGKFTGSMELVKSMYGNFTLNGNHTYTGKTTVSEGTLTINGSLASQVDLRAKGTLTGNAVLNGGIILNKGLNIEGGRLAPGNGLEANKLGRITINSAVSMSGGVNLHFDILPGSTNINDDIIINGNLTTSGVNSIIVNTANGTLPAGTYSLMQWTGSFSGDVSNFNIKGISGLPVSLFIENNTLKLVVNAVRATSSVVWSGAVNGNWDFTTNNFSSGASSTYFVTGDAVTVNDQANNTTIAMGDHITPSQLNFGNNTKSIIITGEGGISGSGNVIYTGTNLVDIQNTGSDYTGITSLVNARVKIAALSEAGTSGALGAASVSPSNLTLNTSTLYINASNTYTDRGMTLTGNDSLHIVKSNSVATITGVVTGTGKLIKSGPGQLNLSGSAANTFSGGTQISEGTIALGSLIMNKSGLGSGPISLENGGVLKMFYYEDDYSQNPSWNISIAEGQTGSLIASGRCNINGTISGGGTLNYHVPYLRADLVSTGANFTGTMNVTTDADGGDFRITMNSVGFPKAQINLNNLVGMAYHASLSGSTPSTTTTAIIGSLSGTTGSKLGTGKWQIGSDNRDAIFNGIIQSGAIITKVGSGNWTITGANLCTSNMNINGGKLTVSNTTGSGTGTSTVVVGTSGTLSGTGTIAGATTVNGTLAGNLRFNSNLTLTSGSNTNLVINGFTVGQFDSIKVDGTITKNGTLTIQANVSNPVVSSKIRIIGASSSSGSFSGVILPPGYTFNESNNVLEYVGVAERANWEGTGNWSDATKWDVRSIPGQNTKVTIKSGHVSVDNVVTVDSLIVDPGASVTINAGKSITTNILLKSNALGTGTFINTGTCNFSSSTIKQKVFANRNWYFSSPVTSATFGSLFQKSQNDFYSPPLGMDEPGVTTENFWKYNEIQASWSQIDNASETMATGKGYIANVPQDTVLTFTGAFNDGEFAMDFTRTENGLAKRGFNLAGNPYPSYLNWDLVEKTNMMTTIWYRTKNGANNYVFDTYNATGGIATSIGSQAVTHLIPPMQAFWVRVAAGQNTGSFRTTNNMRSHRDVTGNLLKSPQLVNPILRLKISNGSNFDETVLYFHPKALNGADAYDSPKMLNNSINIPDLYTMLGSEEYVINGMSEYKYGDFVPIGMNCGVKGTYMINASQLAGFDADTKIILIDKSNGIQTDLTTGDTYSFESDKTTGTSRFEILFKSASTITELTSVQEQFKVYVSDNYIHIESNEAILTNTKVSIFNLAGLQIYSNTLKDVKTIIKKEFAQGVYLIQLENETWKTFYKVTL